MKASVFIATSLDGFIARDDGSVEWLEVEETNEDYGFAAHMDSVDALVMGRNTYDFVASTGMWHYGDKLVIVLTTRPLEIPAERSDTVEASDLAPAELAKELDGRGIERVYVDGGATIQSFLDAGLVDRMSITTIPILLGSGIPLFGPSQQDIHLRHVNTVTYTNGLVQTTYDVS